MTSAQHIFYILGSVWFGLFILFVLFLLIAAIAIQVSIHRLLGKVHDLADDAKAVASDISRISSAVADKVDTNLMTIASKILTGILGIRRARKAAKRKKAEAAEEEE